MLRNFLLLVLISIVMFLKIASAAEVYPVEYTTLPYHDYSIQNKQHRIYWTFDDHPLDITSRYLDVLRQNGIKGTFFIVGQPLLGYYKNPAYRPAQRAYDNVRKMLQDGHAVGNHSVSHRIMCTLTSKELRWEVGETQSLLQKTIGALPSLWRPPHGKVCSALYNVVQANKLTSIMWDVDDYRHAASTVWFYLNKRIQFGYNHTVLLFHVNVKTLEDFIALLKKNTTQPAIPTKASGVRTKSELTL